MGENDLAVWVVADSLVVYHVEGGCSRLEGVADHWLRKTADLARIDRMGRVDKYDGGTTVELSPDVLEIGVAQVVIISPITGKQGHTVRLEGVEGVGDLGKSQLLIKKVRQSGKKAVFLGVIVSQFGSVQVSLAGELCRCCRVLEDAGTRGSQRQDGDIYAELLVDGGI